MGLKERFLLRPGPVHSLPACRRGAAIRFPELSEEVATPELARMPLRPGAGHLRAATYRTPEVSAEVLRGMMFNPEVHVVHTRARTAVAESISTRLPKGLRLRDCYGRPVRRIEGPCSTFRSVKNGYYHTLIDNLPRLYLLHHDSLANLGTIELLCGSEPSRVERYYLDRLLPAHARVRVVPARTLWRTDRFVLLDFLTRRFSGYLPTRYVEWFLSRVAPNRPSARTRRILISRAPTHKGPQRNVLNEDELARALEPRGFRPYRLEAMPIAEQIELFHDAEFVVAPHGAGLANLVFSRRIKVVELFSTPRIAPHYHLLARARGCRHAVVRGTAERQNANFRVDVDAVAALVDELDRTVS